jgi:pimeloyl-ACP methyl ester carboxylesterase
MQFRKITAGMFGCGLFLSSLLSAGADPVPIEDLARLPAISNVSVTSDGNTMFALVGPATGDDQDRAVMASWDLNDLSKPPKTVAPDSDTEFMFLNALKDGHVFVAARKPFTGQLSGCSEGRSIGSTRTWLMQFFITDASFDEFESPFLDERGMRGMSEATKTCLRMEARGSIVSSLPLDPKNVLISRVEGRTFSSEVGTLNLETGQVDVIYKNTSARGAGYIDPSDGEIMTASGVDEDGDGFELDVFVRAAKGESMEKHPALSVDLSARQELNIVHWDNDAKLYYINTNKFSDLKEIWAYDPVAREYVGDQPVFAHEDFEAGGVIKSTRASDFGRILGFNYSADIVRTEWIDSEVGGIVLGLENAFQGQSIGLIYASDDRNRVVFSVSDSNQPARYFMLTDKAKLTAIADQRPWIDGAAIGKTDLVEYIARDGRKLWALLTPRAGWQPGDAPGKAIVLPHGGPWARDFGGWDSSGWIAFLTSRGFTVLQPQYRGSTGWGLELWKAGDGQFGYIAQDDKDDAAAWLVSEGYAESDAIGIFGYSYGGYAAMAAATRTNSPYQCAIAGAGYGESDKINVSLDQNRYGRMVFGSALSGRDVIKDVKNSEIPILVYHGDRDVRVPDTYGKAFYRAIRSHTEAKYVNIPEMGHSLPWTPDQHRLSLSAIESFLDNECGFDW